MSRRQLKRFLLLTSALGAIALAGAPKAAPEDASVSELLKGPPPVMM